MLVLTLTVWVFPALLNRYPRRGASSAQILTAINATRASMVLLLAGVAAFVTLAYTIRSYNLSQSGQVTERYTKAVEQLGSGKQEIRLGGIFALERIGDDSVRDRSTVIEVLAAFVRLKSLARRGFGWRTLTRAPVRGRVAEDVQAALTVIARRRASINDLPVDLHDAWLAGAILKNGQFSRSLLERVHLEGADLSDANLVGAVLRGSHLVDANLSAAHLLTAVLSDADMLGTNLYKAHIEKGQLSLRQCQEAINVDHVLWYKSRLGELVQEQT